MRSLGLSVEGVSTWEVLMIYPYLVLHMRSLGLSVEEVSTGRF
jgi:hypothetical protein